MEISVEFSLLLGVDSGIKDTNEFQKLRPEQSSHASYPRSSEKLLECPSPLFIHVRSDSFSIKLHRVDLITSLRLEMLH